MLDFLIVTDDAAPYLAQASEQPGEASELAVPDPEPADGDDAAADEDETLVGPKKRPKRRNSATGVRGVKSVLHVDAPSAAGAGARLVLVCNLQ